MEHLPLPLLGWGELHYILHEWQIEPPKAPRITISEALVEEIREMLSCGKTREAVCEEVGMAWGTLERILDKHAIPFKRYGRTADEIAMATARYGDVEALRTTICELRSRGVGWSRLSKMVGLNRYACKVLVEEGRVTGVK